MIVDHVAAGRFPAWAIGGEHQGTMVGGLVNLALLLALTFWPSAVTEAYTNPFEPPVRTASKPSTSDQRLARVSQGTARPTWS
jgi:hypothetical protein